MKKLFAILFLFPVLAFGQRIPLYNTNTLWLTPSNLLASNFVSTAAVKLDKGQFGNLSLSISNASVADAMLASTFKKLDAPETNLVAYANHATNLPVRVNGFAATTTNLSQYHLMSDGPIVARLNTNGFWLSKYDVVFTNITTDGTITTLGAITIPNDSVWRLDTWVNAYSPGFTNAGGYHRAGMFSCTNGVARMIGAAVTTGGTGEDNSGWDCTVDASGATARVRVTGASNQTNKWTGLVRIVPQVW